jgi:hypothetical protein
MEDDILPPPDPMEMDFLALPGADIPDLPDIPDMPDMPFPGNQTAFTIRMLFNSEL